MATAKQLQEVLHKLAKFSLETEGAVKPKAEREKKKQFSIMVVVARTVAG